MECSPPKAVSWPPQEGSPLMRYRSFFLGVVLGAAVTFSAVNIYAIVRAREVLLQQRDAMARAMALGSRPLPSPWFPRTLGPSDLAWGLQDLDGKSVRLSDFKGRVIFLDFWATWCGPCVDEIPSMQKLAQSVQGQPVSFLLVTDEDPQKVRDFVANRHLSLPVYLRRNDIPERLRAPGVPVTYVVDPAGTVVFRQRGVVNWDTDEARRFLADLSQTAARTRLKKQ